MHLPAHMADLTALTEGAKSKCTYTLNMYYTCLLHLAPETSPGDIPVEHLDYEYLKTCTNASEVESILLLLRSGKEGIYPDLIVC